MCFSYTFLITTDTDAVVQNLSLYDLVSIYACSLTGRKIFVFSHTVMWASIAQSV